MIFAKSLVRWSNEVAWIPNKGLARQSYKAARIHGQSPPIQPDKVTRIPDKVLTMMSNKVTNILLPRIFDTRFDCNDLEIFENFDDLVFTQVEMIILP